MFLEFLWLWSKTNFAIFSSFYRFDVQDDTVMLHGNYGVFFVDMDRVDKDQHIGTKTASQDPYIENIWGLQQPPPLCKIIIMLQKKLS